MSAKEVLLQVWRFDRWFVTYPVRCAVMWALDEISSRDRTIEQLKREKENLNNELSKERKKVERLKVEVDYILESVQEISANCKDF